ncbi:thiol-disulfide oxidoreductase DCC family protein [Roseinatronobacter sp.]|uniref:thiol-disulfide oxidoreductase DCC family protein n=1 Tax=Roseinatronobacter sp. TaxID=1945755 RepID=UPI0025D4EF20|nr:DCC1-like thiol-disulfide oxidoreductase family protein [Rhodobaca sp.]
MTPLRIIYDGECPFCASYVRLLRLRESHAVRLIDARIDPETARGYGLDLNEGMIVDLDGEVYHGARAVALLSRLSRGPGLLRSDRVAERVYPWMRRGRALVLTLLGRKPL